MTTASTHPALPTRVRARTQLRPRLVCVVLAAITGLVLTFGLDAPRPAHSAPAPAAPATIGHLAR